MNRSELSAHIDHTLLKQDARREDIVEACTTARELDCRTVCVNSGRVGLAAQTVAGSGIGVSATVGFPFGTMRPEVKALETRLAVEDGATEIDMVINVGAARDADFAMVEADVAAVVDAAAGHPVKAILECGLLTDDQKRRAAEAALRGGARFLKTGTGYFGSPATLHDVQLLSAVARGRAEVKAAGGIAYDEDAEAMLAAGATRLGVSRTRQLLNSAPPPVAEAPHLLSMLDERGVRLHYRATSVEDAIRESGRLLFQQQATEPRYVDAMWRVFNDLGPYMVIAPGVALLHARPEDGVLRPSFSWLSLDPPLEFGSADNDPIDLALGFCAVDSDSHVAALAQLANLLQDAEIMADLRRSTSPGQVLQVIQRWLARQLEGGQSA